MKHSVTMLLALAFVPALQAELRITFEGSRVIVGGVRPGGRAILFGVARDYGGRGISRIVRVEQILVDSTRSGEVTHQLEGPVPLKSVWSAVDLDNGQTGVAAGPGFTLSRIGRNDRRPDILPPQALDKFQSDGDYIDGIAVRRGEGVWGIRAEDGGSYDADGVNNGNIVFVAENFYPIAGSPKTPRQLTRGSIIVLIDQQSLEHFVFGVPESSRP